MQLILPLKNEDGAEANCALRVTRNPEGRVQVCKVSDKGAPLGASADVSQDAMQSLQNLGFGQTCWLPNKDEPQFRVTGEGKLVEIRENRASSEPLFLTLEELQGALSQIN